VLPTLLAAAVGFFIFRNRVRGVYFSIITQALAWGAFLAFSRNELLLGGTNGLTNFYKPLNSDPRWILGLYLITTVMLVSAFVTTRELVLSRFGRVLMAIRDNETRLLFMGYRPEIYKALAFAWAALLAGVAGLLYVPQNGIVTPNVMRVEDSIWMVIWVAVGGRGRLWGAVAGAILANFTYSMLTSDMPRAWPFIQAGLFLAVLVFPDGLSKLWIDLEAEVQAGERFGRRLIAFGFVLLFLILDKMNGLPLVLSLHEFMAIQAKYWILLAATMAWGWSRAAPASMPLLALSGLILSEALGFIPGEARILKYLVVAAMGLLYLSRQSGLTARFSAAPWRVRPASSNA
jgi:branched-subunit amino acid ABC-type transport system permease component